jgi:hypothetical protein
MSTSTLYPIISPSLNLDFTNSKVLDPRVTFARASGATYYDGVTTAKAEENLLLQSQEFDNALWTKNDVTVTANSIAAPDGTTTAETITESATTATHRVLRNASTIAGVPYSSSVFVKNASGSRYVGLRLSLNTSPANYAHAVFDLSAVTSNTNASISSASIVSVGNSWYRISMTTINSDGTVSTNPFIVYLSDTATAPATNSIGVSYAGDGVSAVYLWGAQLEQRSSVTAYTPTTTQAITNYVPVLQTAANNVPRFDHNPVTGESLGLLIEESRTNLLTYSDDFADAVWTKSNVSITANIVISPDGMLSADLIVPDTSNVAHIIQYPNITANTTTTSTVSFFVKKAGYTTIHLRYGVQSTANRGQSDINLVTGAVTNLQNVGTATGAACSATNIGNDWWRVAFSVNPNDASATQTRLLIYPNVSAVYAGDGYSGIYIWGAQLEAGAFPTSYIATGAAAATRSADAASMTGTNFSSWYRADEGTVYSDVNLRITPATQVQFLYAISNNSVGERINSATGPGAGGNFNATVSTSSVLQAQTINGSLASAGNYKYINAYKVNDFASVVNGGSAVTDTSGNLPIVNRLYIGASQIGTSGFINGTIRKLAYYPLRLTNAQLQALTS